MREGLRGPANVEALNGPNLDVCRVVVGIHMVQFQSHSQIE